MGRHATMENEEDPMKLFASADEAVGMLSTLGIHKSEDDVVVRVFPLNTK